MLPLSGLLSQQVLRVCACVHAWVRVFLVRAHIEVCIHVKIAHDYCSLMWVQARFIGTAIHRSGLNRGGAEGVHDHTRESSDTCPLSPAVLHTLFRSSPCKICRHMAKATARHKIHIPAAVSAARTATANFFSIPCIQNTQASSAHLHKVPLRFVHICTEVCCYPRLFKMHARADMQKACTQVPRHVCMQVYVCIDPQRIGELNIFAFQ